MSDKSNNIVDLAKKAAEMQFGKQNQAFQKQEPIMPTDPKRDLLRRYAKHKATVGGPVIEKKANEPMAGIPSMGASAAGLGLMATPVIGGLAGAGTGALMAPSGGKNKAIGAGRGAVRGVGIGGGVGLGGLLGALAGGQLGQPSFGSGVGSALGGVGGHVLTDKLLGKAKYDPEPEPEEEKSARVSLKRAEDQGPPNYRQGSPGLQSCKSCSNYETNTHACTKYGQAVAPEAVCDSYEEKSFDVSAVTKAGPVQPIMTKTDSGPSFGSMKLGEYQEALRKAANGPFEEGLKRPGFIQDKSFTGRVSGGDMTGMAYSPFTSPAKQIQELPGQNYSEPIIPDTRPGSTLHYPAGTTGGASALKAISAKGWPEPPAPELAPMPREQALPTESPAPEVPTAQGQAQGQAQPNFLQRNWKPMAMGLGAAGLGAGAAYMMDKKKKKPVEEEIAPEKEARYRPPDYTNREKDNMARLSQHPDTISGSMIVPARAWYEVEGMEAPKHLKKADAKQAFKYGFLMKCAEEGLSIDEIQAKIDSAIADMEKKALIGDAIGKGLDIGGTLLLGGPALLGGLTGYSLAKSRNNAVPDVNKLKREELKAEYLRLADQAQRRRMIQSMQEHSPGSIVEISN